MSPSQVQKVESNCELTASFIEKFMYGMVNSEKNVTAKKLEKKYNEMKDEKAEITLEMSDTAKTTHVTYPLFNQKLKIYITELQERINNKDLSALPELLCIVNDRIRSYDFTTATPIGCDVFLMGIPNSGKYKESDREHLYLYKDSEQEIFYYIDNNKVLLKDPSQMPLTKDELDRFNEKISKLTFAQNENDNLQPCPRKVSHKILEITSKRHHTLGAKKNQYLASTPPNTLGLQFKLELYFQLTRDHPTIFPHDLMTRILYFEIERDCKYDGTHNKKNHFLNRVKDLLASPPSPSEGFKQEPLR